MGSLKKKFSRKTHYFIRVSSPKKCKKIRTDDVGKPGGHVRIACQKSNGDWTTQAWRLPKKEYRLKGNEVIPKTNKAKRTYNGILRKNNKKHIILKRNRSDGELR